MEFAASGLTLSRVAEDSVGLSFRGTSLPDRFPLSPNYPNPFNLETTIEYALPEAARVQLSVYNLRGQRVRVLVDAFQPAGYQRVVWNGRNAHGDEVSSGLYFVRFRAGETVLTRRMLLQK